MRIILVSALALSGLAACEMMPDDHAAGIHDAHAHVHGDDCGHEKVRHADHWDYLHDGHLHYVHDGHVDDHSIEVSEENPADESPVSADLHADHMHGDGDMHSKVPHGDHTDFVHEGRLHYVHGDHVDDHGPIAIEKNG